MYPTGTVVMVPARKASPAADSPAGSNNRLPCGAPAAAAGRLLSASVDSLRSSVAAGVAVWPADEPSAGSGGTPAESECTAGDDTIGAVSCCCGGRCSDQLTRDLRPPSSGTATLRSSVQQAQRQWGVVEGPEAPRCAPGPVLAAAPARRRVAIFD